MSLEQMSFIAEIIGSLGVIISLLFVGAELRKNTIQSKLSNYGDMVDRFMVVYATTNDIELSKLIIRGRKCYRDLGDEEKLSFGHYMENMCIALESLLQYDKAVVHRPGETMGLFDKHLGYHLSFPGTREWFTAFEQERGFPPPFMQEIHRVLRQEGYEG